MHPAEEFADLAYDRCSEALAEPVAPNKQQSIYGFGL
jgi:hypothetical protein